MKHVNFLKIDCEGAEYDILLNTSKSIFKRIGKIALERHNVKNHTVQELKNILIENDF